MLDENGGEGGIRTLDTGLGYTPLAGERLRPLGHLSEKLPPVFDDKLYVKQNYLIL